MTTTASPAESGRSGATWAAGMPGTPRSSGRARGPLRRGCGRHHGPGGGIEAPFVLEIVEPRRPLPRPAHHGRPGDPHRPRGARERRRRRGHGHAPPRRPGAADVGPMVTGDTPKALAALVAMAEKKSAGCRIRPTRSWSGREPHERNHHAHPDHHPLRLPRRRRRGARRRGGLPPHRLDDGRRAGPDVYERKGASRRRPPSS